MRNVNDMDEKYSIGDFICKQCGKWDVKVFGYFNAVTVITDIEKIDYIDDCRPVYDNKTRRGTLVLTYSDIRNDYFDKCFVKDEFTGDSMKIDGSEENTIIYKYFHNDNICENCKCVSCVDALREKLSKNCE